MKYPHVMQKQELIHKWGQINLEEK